MKSCKALFINAGMVSCFTEWKATTVFLDLCTNVKPEKLSLCAMSLKTTVWIKHHERLFQFIYCLVIMHGFWLWIPLFKRGLITDRKKSRKTQDWVSYTMLDKAWERLFFLCWDLWHEMIILRKKIKSYVFMNIKHFISYANVHK